MSRLRPLADTQYHSWFPPQFISSLFCRDRSSAEITLSGLTMFDGHIFDLDLPRSRGRVALSVTSCRVYLDDPLWELWETCGARFPQQAAAFFRISCSSQRRALSRRSWRNSSRSTVVRRMALVAIGLAHPVANRLDRRLELLAERLRHPPEPDQVDHPSAELSCIRSV